MPKIRLNLSKPRVLPSVYRDWAYFDTSSHTIFSLKIENSLSSTLIQRALLIYHEIQQRRPKNENHDMEY